ncbi:MAG TPA: hypothetical protein DD490_10240 [Acidobacteria bacterium]|nr:hypothetical protein [Acidobacteriota bacterium]
MLAAVLGLLPAAASAIDLTDKVHLSGFGHWQYGRTDGNTFLGATEDGEYDNGDFALSVSAQVSDPLRIAGQLHLAYDGTTELDFAFAEYSLSDAAKLRAGLVKHPFGISTEVLHVGTLRLLGDLPQSLYGTTGVVSEAIKGLAFAGRKDFASSWALSYDVYAGELNPFNDGLNHELLEPGIEEDEEEELSYRDALGARAVLETPVDGLSFGVSAYRGVEEEDGTTAETLGGHVRFARGAWDVRAEAFGQHAESGAIEQRGYYLEAARRFGEKWQVAALAESFEVTPESGTGPSFAGDPRSEHDLLALGLNYWFSPNLVFRTSVREIEGLRFVEIPDDQEPAELDESTRLFTFGVDFSF